MVNILEKLKKKLTRKQKIFIWFLIFVFIIMITIGYLNENVNPAVMRMSESKVRALSNKAVNESIYEVSSNENVYDDLVNISYDNNGNVVLIQANSLEINNLTREIVKVCQKNLEEIGEDAIRIPIGSLTGVPIFNGRGPSLNFRVVPVGSIVCNFVSSFESAGINQTNHKIYINIETKVSLLLPTDHKDITTITQILVCESIIVGNVPEVYLNTPDLDNSLNLVPD